MYLTLFAATGLFAFSPFFYVNLVLLAYFVFPLEACYFALPHLLVPCFVRGLLTGKFKRNDQKATATLAGTRLGWVAEKPTERTFSATPDIETLRNDERFWKLMDTVEAIGKQHGRPYHMSSKIVHCKYKFGNLHVLVMLYSHTSAPVLLN